MRKITLLSLLLLATTTLLAQNTIRITSAAEIGDEMVFTMYSTSSNDPLTVDWGDGTTTTHNISPNDIPYMQRVAGTLKGETITITGNVVSLTATNLHITQVEISNQTALTKLYLSQNEITDISFIGDVAPLEILELNNNRLTNSTENNPTLGLEIFSETLQSLNLNDNNLVCLNIESLVNLKSLYVKNNPLFTSIFIALPEESRNIEKIDLSNGDLSHFYPITMPQLTSLHLSNNVLMEDFVIDDYYPALKYLSIDGNFIPQVDITACRDLEQFDCSRNQLTTIDVSQNSQLTHLQCSSNRLTSLDVSNNVLLTTLRCDSNELKKIDVLKNTMLQNINISSNPISYIDLTNTFNLKRFEAANTLCDYFYFNYVNPGGRFEYIDVRNNSNLTAAALNCMYMTLPIHYGRSYNNTLLIEGSNGETSDTSYPNSEDMGWKTDITGDGTALNDLVSITIDAEKTGKTIDITGLFGGINTEQSYTMTEYSTDNGTFAIAQWAAPYYQKFNEVTDKANIGVPIVIFAYPQSGYQFKNIEVNGKVIENNWFVINEEATVKVNFDVDEKSISFTTTQGIPLSFQLGGPDEVNTIEIDWGNGSRQEYEIPQYADYQIAGGRIEGSSVGNTITIYGNVTYANFESEPYFVGWDNRITAIDLSQNTMLEYLDLYWNPVQSIDLTGQSQLEVLGVSYTAIKELNLTGASNLLQLECYSDGYGWEEDGIAMLSQLDLSQTPKLRYLDAKNNRIETINFDYTPDLSYINITGNNITSVNLSQLPGLWYFLAANNNLQELNLTQNVELVELSISNNNITELDLSSNNSIELLSIENNAITLLDVSNLRHLKQLKIGGNGLSACQLNDIYYSLPQYPELTTEEQEAIAGYPLNVGQAGEEYPNDAYGADASIATSKGWNINIAGNGNGCETAYIDILPSENGYIRLYDVDNNEILSGTTTLRNSTITVVATPDEGYIYNSIMLNNNERIEGETFMIGAYCQVQAIFNSDDAVNDTKDNSTRIYAGHKSIHVVTTEHVKVEIYSIDGSLIHQSNVWDNMSMNVASGMYIVRVWQGDNFTTRTLVVR